MHWLAERVKRLHELRGIHDEYVRLGEHDASGMKEAKDLARRDFLAAARELVYQIADRYGVDGCFVAYDGLPFESAGTITDLEGWSAMAQDAIETSKRISEKMTMGDLRQTVVIGEQLKLALFWIGPIVLGIVSATEVSLGDSLSR